MMSSDIAALCFQWTTARKQLSQALDAYHLACNSLSALGVQAGAILESAQPDFPLSIETNLPLLQREANCIINSLDSLKKLRNGSTKLVPINRLPPELLASIFSIVVEASRANPPPRVYPKGRIDFLNALSSVSSYWRHVSLTTPALWAALTLDTRGVLNHAALWLERSRSCPLRLSSQSYINSNHAQDLAGMFGRQSGRFQSLVLCLDPNLGDKIFNDACVQHTEDSVRLESLAIDAGIRGLTAAYGEMKWPPKNLMDRFLKSVHTLYVRHRLFDDWSSTAFHDLTSLSLRMISSKFLPTCTEPLDVLCASPGLRSLELSSLSTLTVPRHNATPIHLKSLEVLWIDNLSPRFSRWLLKSIIPHSDGLTLSISDTWSDELPSIGYKLPFSIPDRVRVLYIHSQSGPTLDVDLRGLLKSLTRLETLAFKGVRISLIDSTPHPSDGRDSILATLDLVSCEVTDVPLFRSMLVQHSVLRLRLFECKGCPTSDELIEASPGLLISSEPGEFMRMFSPFDCSY